MASSASGEIQQILRAAHFAAVKHAAQRRKGEAAEPYVNHLLEVAHLVAESGADSATVTAALLHDSVEDTATTREELVAEFGEAVAAMVMEVTDDKSLPKAERKRLQVERAPHKSAAAQAIKIADKISNLRSILNSPPSDWSEERKREYFDFAKAVVDGLDQAPVTLKAEFTAVFARL
jgi:GTP diphosphokinase / guanosine-3',5'-bis(diphosphate) 3'-diphosphatase